MKLRISLPMPIVLCLLTIVIVAVSPAVAAGDNKAKSATSTPDIAPDTVLLKIQLEENKPPLELTLKQLMETYNIPGLSVAVVDNYQIVWAKGFGVTEHGGKSPVTTRTLFQAGSISKPVAAVGAMWLVEHGKLKTFQRNVQEYPHAWNPYDSLGEAYMTAGQKELAIKNYEKSLELNPQNTNGVEMLKKLKKEE